MSRIMIVEDNPVVQRMVTHIVSRQGHYTETADNGHQALQILSESKDKYDLIITDAKMPELDGLGLIDAIRALPGSATIPFILMTAYLDIYEYISPEKLSDITVLTKPIASQDLREALNKVLGPNGAAAATPHLTAVDQDHIRQASFDNLNDGNVGPDIKSRATSPTRHFGPNSPMKSFHVSG